MRQCVSWCEPVRRRWRSYVVRASTCSHSYFVTAGFSPAVQPGARRIHAGCASRDSIIRPLRQEKSWKGEWKRNLKPFEAIQRVRPPPGRGAALQPEASLAWETATSLVKRRQQMLKPCVSLEIVYPLGPSVWASRGRCRQDR